MAKLQSRIVNDFTVIHNEFVRDERLGIEEKGMLLILMSLPADWNFSIEGLTKVSRSGKCKVTTALNGLKKYGYFRRTREVDENTGRVIDWLYEFSDQPHPEWIEETNENDDNRIKEIDVPEQTKIENTEEPENKNVAENPQSDFRHLENRHLENQPQYNTNKYNTNKLMIDGCGEAEVQRTKELVREQINETNELVDYKYATEEEVEEIVDIITEVYLSDDAIVTINGNSMKMTRVQAQFRKLTSEHIAYFFQQLSQNKKPIVNMKKYIITGLYNSVMTYNNHLTADVARIMNTKQKNKSKNISR